MINFILDLEYLIGSIMAPLLIVSLGFYRYFNIKVIISLFFICFFLILATFSAKPDEKFINSLKENNISQELLEKLNKNETLGFRFCKMTSYNGETCHDYLKYVISSLKTKQEELKKRTSKKLQKEQFEKQKEQFELNNKNKNIENIVENSFKAKDKE
ncbi:hypothetical protein CSUB8523_0682 [Campylobacter subantarcticus LMG 24377]|uniref:Uncharacterized protein n=1 Tax=Campylobacter subantarcticus TaxID=497724 RepID=A0ABW9N4X4_9BACT|nr:hypothetical protein [Campylobacter subantarcticus]AJC92206.1 hypothetical protein CSUB8523_0682 [Campylobacter subantarcticus LMG 24377]EAL3938367.1 hypothetical protein [Campylobacter lari]MPB99296.1 hypothetical protein [Campylobacter subantarcticus]